MILVGRLVVSLLAANLLAVPAAAWADGIMLIQAGAFWMGRDDGPPTPILIEPTTAASRTPARPAAWSSGERATTTRPSRSA